MVYLKGSSEDIWEKRKINEYLSGKRTCFSPYASSLSQVKYGKYAYWKASLKHLKGSRENLYKLIAGNLLLGRVPIIPVLQLSILKPGSFIAPHTDISSKLASIMIYLPSGIEIKYLIDDLR